MTAKNKHVRILSAQVRVKTVSATAVERGTEHQTTMVRFFGNNLNQTLENRHANLAKQ